MGYGFVLVLNVSSDTWRHNINKSISLSDILPEGIKDNNKYKVGAFSTRIQKLA